jgi:hypothetical protein
MSGLAVFDEVLDPEALREALENVFRRPGWERLGGRLKTNVSIGYILRTRKDPAVSLVLESMIG